jgi:Fe-S-cluster-containing hydrogenase component 2
MPGLAKVMVINPLLCTGCLQCELVCSINKTGMANPADSRIKITKEIGEDVCIPIICRHCNPAPCEQECPTEAIGRDPTTGAVLINYDLCINCQQCLTACPFGAIHLSTGGDVIKCDLCGGDPRCVKFCKPRPANSSSFMSNPRASALQFVAPTEATRTKRLMQRRKFLKFLSE